MAEIHFDSGDNQAATLHGEVRHRRALVEQMVASLDASVVDDDKTYANYDDWYLSALKDGLFRRVFVIEYREWSRHVQDLIRDQLSRNGLNSSAWDDLRRAPGKGGFVDKARLILAEELNARLPDALWEQLEELRAVAETISQGTREARESLRERYPDYFSGLDVFGDGDEAARLTLSFEHAQRAFAACEAFWDPEDGLPHHESLGAA